MSLKTMTSALIVGLALSGAANATEKSSQPDADAGVVAALNKVGFQTWRKIRHVHGHWRIYDAVHADGRVFKVELDDSDYKVTQLKLEKHHHD